MTSQYLTSLQSSKRLRKRVDSHLIAVYYNKGERQKRHTPKNLTVHSSRHTSKPRSTRKKNAPIPNRRQTSDDAETLPAAARRLVTRLRHAGVTVGAGQLSEGDTRLSLCPKLLPPPPRFATSAGSHVPSHDRCGLRHSWLSSIVKQKHRLTSRKRLPIYTYNTKGVLC